MLNRNKKLAFIHVAKKQCGLDDESYKGLLLGSAGISSAKDIKTEEQFTKVVAAFKKLGVKYNSTFKKKKITDPQLAKCYALWCELFKIGAVKNKKYSSLKSWLKRQLGEQDIYTGAQLSSAIEELKKWLERVDDNDRDSSGNG